MINNRRYRKNNKFKKLIAHRQKKIWIRNLLMICLTVGVITTGITMAVNMAASPDIVYLSPSTENSDFSWYITPEYSVNNSIRLKTYNMYANQKCYFNVAARLSNYNATVNHGGEMDLIVFEDFTDGYKSNVISTSETLYLAKSDDNSTYEDQFIITVDKEKPTCDGVELVKSNKGWYYNASAVSDNCGIKTSGYLTQGGLTASEVLEQLNSSNTGTKFNLTQTNESSHYYFYVVDYVNNLLEIDCGTLDYVDWTAPSVEEEFIGGKELDGKHYYGLSDLGSSYVARVSDNLSSIVNISPLSDSDQGELGASNFLDGTISQNQYSTTIQNIPDGTYSIGFKADDNRNNSLISCNLNQIIVDTTKPSISSMTLHSTEDIIMTENNGVFTSSGENNFNSTNISLKVKVQEENIQSFSANFNGSELQISDGSEEVIDNKKYVSYSIPLNIEITEREQILISIEDKLGNNAYYTVTGLNIDTIAPTVNSLKLNDMDILTTENHTFGSDLSIEGIIEELSLDKTSIKISLESLDEDGLVDEITELTNTNIISNGNYHSFLGSKTGVPDGRYQIRIKGKDASNNDFNVVSKRFYVDGTDPVLTVKVTDGITPVPYDESKETSKVIILSITDLNPDKNSMISFEASNINFNQYSIDDIKCKINGTLYEGSLSGLLPKIGDFSSWVKDNLTYTCSIEVLTEGNYSFKNIYAADEVGNTSDKKNINFTIDGTAPVIDEISFSVEQNRHEDYQYISNTPIKVTVLSIDNISEVSSLKADYSVNGAKRTINFKKSGEGEFSYTFGVNEKTKGFINNITVTDSNGNSLTKNMGEGVIVDQETEDIELLKLEIKDNAGSNSSNIYNQDIQLQFSGEDTFSGLKNIGYTINEKGNTDDYSASKKLVYSYKKSEVLKASPENEGDNIPVILSATDNAGNEKSIRKDYTIDITNPEISVSYDTTSDNGYYNENRTAIISINDKHFDNENTEFIIHKNGNDEKINLAFSTRDNINYTASYTFKEDGDYTFDIIAKDLAGNTEEYNMNNRFTIDKTIPFIEITFDNNQSLNENYFSSARTATIKITEHNFDPNLVHIESSGLLNGTVIASPNISSFTTNGDTHTATITYNTDGDYTLSASVSDLAGNHSAVVKADAFTIDLTEPSIEIINVEEGKSYNDIVTPIIKIEDANYDISAISISLQGTKHGANKELTYSSSNNASGGIYTFDDFAHKQEVDDCYTLKVTGSDMAGNRVDGQVSFKVNRFGSVYSLNDYTKKAIDEYYTTAKEDFVINEINVDEITDRDLYYSKDGSIVYLEENRGYKVSHNVDTSNWNQYTYHIDTDGITEDGIYTFTLYSKDKSGNEMDTKTKNIDFTLCVDKTAPSVVITGLENNKVYEEDEKEITINVSDNIALDYIVTSLNGEEKTYQAEDIKDDTIKIKISEKTSSQTFNVKAYDMAGNRFDSGEKSFTLSSNKIVTAVHNHMGVFIIGCTIFVVLVGIIIFITMRKKTKGKLI